MEWKTEVRKVKDLIPFQYNPRILTDTRKQLLLESIEKFNLVEIPVINLDNTLLAGHQRLVVLMELGRGDEDVDVRVPNRMLTETEVKEYNLRSNVSIGFWDTDILDQFFGEIDLAAIGLNMDSIELPDDIKPVKEEEEDEFVIIEPVNPLSSAGDLIEMISLDKNLHHRVICGSSTDPVSVSNLFQDNRCDLTVTDPPYNVNYTGGTKNALKIQNDNMDDEQFFNFLFDFYSLAHQYSEEGAPIYVFHADSEGANFRTAMKQAGFKLAQCLIWLKNSIVMGRQDYHWIHEPILYGWKLGAAHNWYSDRTQRTVLEFDKPLRNEDHPTMKPLPIIEYLINNSSRRYNIVYDGFLGSGSTLLSCEKQKRHCYGQELDPVYMDVIIRRWIDYMKYNGLDFKIIRNGIELHEEEVQEYYQRAREQQHH